MPILLPEAIPPPFTLTKFYWGMSLFWSWRGIGWNYCCPLPFSARRPPFTRSSSRRAYLLHRLRNTVLLWVFWDIFRSFTNLAPRFSVLLTSPYGTAPPYAEWSYLERAVCSIIVVARIVIGMEKSHLIASLAFVGLGGYMGWEGEVWSPWGWPPLFGSFDEIFKYPGLAVMWSRVSTKSLAQSAGRSSAKDTTDMARVLPKMAPCARVDRDRRERLGAGTLWRISTPPHKIERRQRRQRRQRRT